MDRMIEYAPLLLEGTIVTVLLALGAALLATTLGGLGAAGKLSWSRWLRGLVFGYTSLVRGVPARASSPAASSTAPT